MQKDLMIPCGNNETCGYMMPESEIVTQPFGAETCPRCYSPVNRAGAIDLNEDRGETDTPETDTRIVKPANEFTEMFTETFSDFEMNVITAQVIGLTLLQTGMTGEDLLTGIATVIRGDYRNFLLDNSEQSDESIAEMRRDIRNIALAVKGEAWKLGRIEELAMSPRPENADELETLANKIGDLQDTHADGEAFDILNEAREKVLKLAGLDHLRK